MDVFAPSISALHQLIASYGLDPDTFFQAENIDVNTKFDVDERLSSAAVDRIGARAAAATSDPFFGLKEARYFRPAHLGPLGFAWLASSTLRTAVERLERFQAMVSGTLNIHSRESGSDFAIVFHVTGDSEDPATRDDAVMATLFRMCRILHGPGLVPSSVDFEHAAPADTSGFFELFRCEVHFGAKENRLNLPRDLMDQRLAGGNEALAQMNDHMVVKYLALRDRQDIVNRVKSAILDGLADGGVTEQQVADQFHVSMRHLNRQLAAEGASFRDLLNETRRELALQYIPDQSLTLTEIAFMLGFSEASSFSRAFKRWTGRSPSQAREQTGAP